MRSIQPGGLDGQRGWGKRIPGGYGPEGHDLVAYSDDEEADKAERHYAKAVDLKRDEDVLDTWFSAGLWPFSTLG